MATSSMLSMSSIALKNIVKPPNMVANALDWKKITRGAATAMTINVHADRIGLALATFGGTRSSGDDDETAMLLQRSSSSGSSSSPDNHDHDYFNCRVLDSIPLVSRKRVVSPEDKRRLSGLVREHNISGFVVSWPVQQDTGLMGASCGRTLWTLEQLLLQEDDANLDDDDDDEDEINSRDTNKRKTRRGHPIFTPNRPLCLWDGIHREQPKTDAFGRCPIYSRTSQKTEHCASKEQYHQEDSSGNIIGPAQVWKDFCESHWPVTGTTTRDNRNNNKSASSTLVQSRNNNKHNNKALPSSYSNRISSRRRTTLVAA